MDKNTAPTPSQVVDMLYDEFPQLGSREQAAHVMAYLMLLLKSAGVLRTPAELLASTDCKNGKGDANAN